jgi:hypothetical protein
VLAERRGDLGLGLQHDDPVGRVALAAHAVEQPQRHLAGRPRPGQRARRVRRPVQDLRLRPRQPRRRQRPQQAELARRPGDPHLVERRGHLPGVAGLALEGPQDQRQRVAGVAGQDLVERRAHRRVRLLQPGGERGDLVGVAEHLGVGERVLQRRRQPPAQPGVGGGVAGGQRLADHDRLGPQPVENQLDGTVVPPQLDPRPAPGRPPADGDRPGQPVVGGLARVGVRLPQVDGLEVAVHPVEARPAPPQADGHGDRQRVQPRSRRRHQAQPVGAAQPRPRPGRRSPRTHGPPQAPSGPSPGGRRAGGQRTAGGGHAPDPGRLHPHPRPGEVRHRLGTPQVLGPDPRPVERDGPQVHVREERPPQVRPPQVDPVDLGAGQVGPHQPGADQAGAPQVGAAEHGAAQVGAGEVRVPQVGAGEAGAPQVGAGQVAAPQHGAGGVGPPGGHEAGPHLGQVDAGQPGVVERGAGQVDPGRRRQPAEPHAGERGPDEAGVGEPPAGHLGVAQVGPVEDRGLERGVAQVGPPQVGVPQAGVGEVAGPQVGADEPGAVHPGVPHPLAPQVDGGQVGSDEVDALEVGRRRHGEPHLVGHLPLDGLLVESVLGDGEHEADDTAADEARPHLVPHLGLGAGDQRHARHEQPHRQGEHPAPVAADDPLAQRDAAAPERVARTGPPPVIGRDQPSPFAPLPCSPPWPSVPGPRLQSMERTGDPRRAGPGQQLATISQDPSEPRSDVLADVSPR